MELATAYDLSAILDDLQFELLKSKTKHSWYHNRTHLFDAFKRGALYIVVETVVENPPDCKDQRMQVDTSDKKKTCTRTRK